ncbi:hypothetical protein SAMN05216316_3112 [Nitrosovibrio sp. Nv6]|nr:hypothetical protein SAMN05216316_3112 [Nitrosovibrio sp. Nv6]
MLITNGRIRRLSDNLPRYAAPDPETGSIILFFSGWAPPVRCFACETAHSANRYMENPW